MEDFFNFISFKGGGLEVSFVVIVEECEGLSRICGRDTLCGEEGQKLALFTLLSLSSAIRLPERSGFSNHFRAYI